MQSVFFFFLLLSAAIAHSFSSVRSFSEGDCLGATTSSTHFVQGVCIPMNSTRSFVSTCSRETGINTIDTYYSGDCSGPSASSSSFTSGTCRSIPAERQSCDATAPIVELTDSITVYFVGSDCTGPEFRFDITHETCDIELNIQPTEGCTNHGLTSSMKICGRDATLRSKILAKAAITEKKSSSSSSLIAPTVLVLAAIVASFM
ncbi:hypothetical protein PROFUN_03404 [Planoprotostelium fungivorum]|uniref:Uncharacterized protein n=1 Tax=Planoprotostelium fungivorum TaxID=1890364 RepID=A0A2P6NWF6_9EUKA|nr:hypothetical protein PROFUN_03404 [Planoprotostelium fungivorum]